MVQGYSKTDLCGVGFAPEQAEFIAVRVQSAVAATGTALSTAATSDADVVYISSVHASNNDGFKIREGGAFSRKQVVINGTASTLKLYPPNTSSSINNRTAGASIDIASGIAAAIDTISNTQFWVRT